MCHVRQHRYMHLRLRACASIHESAFSPYRSTLSTTRHRKMLKTKNRKEKEKCELLGQFKYFTPLVRDRYCVLVYIHINSLLACLTHSDSICHSSIRKQELASQTHVDSPQSSRRREREKKRHNAIWEQRKN